MTYLSPRAEQWLLDIEERNLRIAHALTLMDVARGENPDYKFKVKDIASCAVRSEIDPLDKRTIKELLITAVVTGAINVDERELGFNINVDPTTYSETLLQPMQSVMTNTQVQETL